MSFFRLVAAEWSKAIRRPMLRAVIAGVACLGILYLVFALLRNPGETDRERLRELLAIDNILSQASTLLSGLGKVAVCLVAATVFGAEYAFDTWKALIPQRGRRGGFLLAKSLVTVAVSVVVAVVMVSALVLPSLPLAAWFGAPASAAGADASRVPLELAAFIFEILTFTGVAGGAALLARSTLGGVAVGLLFVILLGPLAGADPLAAWVLPAVHLDNLRALLGGDPELLDRAQMAFEAEVPAWASLSVVLGYLTVPLLGAGWWFERRDLASAQ